jgi:hypothetical protein
MIRRNNPNIYVEPRRKTTDHLSLNVSIPTNISTDFVTNRLMNRMQAEISLLTIQSGSVGVNKSVLIRVQFITVKY